jgi:pimeloyl-ACP methyl ester carboxylesterase
MSLLTSKKLFVLASALLRTPGIAACNSTETLVLDDGRTLAYCQYGANRTESDGIKTVIHNNGSEGSRLEWPGDEEMLIRHNISFVSVDRPGHGMSDYQANRTLLGWADDIRQLADHLAIDQFYVEGWSAGGSYALAIAHELQDRVIKGATLSGIGPYDRPNPYDGLPNVQMLTWMRDAREGNLTALLAFCEQMAGIC